MSAWLRGAWVRGALLACVLAPLAGTAEEAASPPTVELRDFMFAPASLTVNAGSTVRWVNRDEEPHTVVAADGSFRSGALDTGQAYAFRFAQPGTYRFTCSIHPRMVGTIIVR
jgi:plastocyanin